MLFSSLVFLFLFLPVVLIVYYILRKKRTLQNIFLFIVSLFFYAWGEPAFVVVLIESIILNWFLALIVDKNRNNKVGGVFVAVAAAADMGLLFVYKYLDFFLTQVNRLGFHFPLRYIVLPIGISFFSFQALSYVIDVYRGEECQKNPLYVGLYIAFFPQLVAGPIVRYKTVADQINHRKESLTLFKSGTIRFMEGFSKKILLANTMAVIADKAYSMAGTELTVSFAWLGAAAYMLQIYFDFSGYSDMAIGLGRMFGFEFEENFYHPYAADTMTDFWRRWHVSLSSWFRDYVYFPLGGSRTGSAARNYFNLLAVWALTGIWHGANWTFIVWGILNFAFLVLEKATPFGTFLRKRKVFARVYTCLAVMLLWVFFRADTISQAILFLKTMFGLTGAAGYTPLTGVYLRENIVYIAAAILFSTEICDLVRNNWIMNLPEKKAAAVGILTELMLFILFGISVVYVINGTYNPFIYFHF